MQVQNPIYSKSFQSRNKTIRFADDIARHVNNCYPRISSTKVECFDNFSKFPNLEPNLMQIIIEHIRKPKHILFNENNSFYENIKAFIAPVKKSKFGNCGESAELAAIVAKLNGIKDCHIATLVKDGEEVDHSVLLVNGKRPYIIDAWLGFADYVPNAIRRYKSEYNKMFNFKESDNVAVATDWDNAYVYFLKDDFTRKQTNKLRRMFPEQVKQRGYV